uniref:Uncharacterized protein n=1 Tax=Anopheles quadriannulatus TaxID=34691 RepID=A0A182XTD6_ANOQN
MFISVISHHLRLTALPPVVHRHSFTPANSFSLARQTSTSFPIVIPPLSHCTSPRTHTSIPSPSPPLPFPNHSVSAHQSASKHTHTYTSCHFRLNLI